VMSLAGFHVGTVLVRRGQARAAWAIFLASFAFFFGWIKPAGGNGEYS